MFFSLITELAYRVTVRRLKNKNKRKVIKSFGVANTIIGFESYLIFFSNPIINAVFWGIVNF